MLNRTINKTSFSVAGLIAVIFLCVANTSLVSAKDNPDSTAQDTRAELSKHANSPDRSDKNRARIDARHPVETLMFFGLRDDMTVVEVAPGSGVWYTEILAPFLRDTGTLYAGSYNPDSESEYQQRGAAKYFEKMAASPELFDQIKQTVFDVPTRMELGPDGVADRVLSFRNFHGWAGDNHELAALQAMYNVLKPGGVMGIVQHRMNEETDEGGKPGDTGYIKTSHVIRIAEQAGFELLAKSEINANPKDTKDHPEGVWTLPPSMALKEVDADQYRAIGESDRMTLKFIKPE